MAKFWLIRHTNGETNRLICGVHCYHSLQNSGVKYIRNKMLRHIQVFFSLPGLCIGKKTAEGLAEAFIYHVSNGLGIPQHFAKDYALAF